MKNIKILNNVPKEVLSAFRNLYESAYKGKAPKERRTSGFGLTFIPQKETSVLNGFLPIPADSIEILYVYNIGPLVKSHIDRGRKTAFQIPIEMDHHRSYTFSTNVEDLSKLTPVKASFPTQNNKIINNPQHWFYAWDESLFDKYNLELPILQNVAQPHGGINLSEKNRIFFSVSYLEDFEYICDKFKMWI